MKEAALKKMAQQDANEWGLAEMFFGEGAGTKRKLIGAAIDQKMHDIPGYAEAFNDATEQLNQLEMAEKAVALRKRIDRGNAVKKNFNAIRTGRLHQLSTGVYVVGGLVYVAHATGYDKKIEAKAKTLYKKAKTEVKFRKAKMQGKNVEKLLD